MDMRFQMQWLRDRKWRLPHLVRRYLQRIAVVDLDVSSTGG
jgi:hypothetical protein